MEAAEGKGMAGWSLPLRFLVRLLGSQGPGDETLDLEGWHAFARLVIERHRLAPATLAALERTGIAPPEAVMGRLRAETRANAFEALAQKAETGRLVQALGESGCRPMLLKGWPLAEELTGSAAGRHSSDIDLYIRREELGTCWRTLVGLGYEAVQYHRARLPLLADPALASECNDLELRNQDRRQVEIHWRSSHFRGWLDLREICGDGREWPLDGTGITIRVPTRTGNLVYLALHGQQHAWLRLKWLLDIARLVRTSEAAELSGVLEAARAAGAERAVVGAVHLANRVFATPLPRGWPEPDRVTRRMLVRFMRGIGAEGAEPGSVRARFDFYWVGFVMAERPAQRLGVLRYAFWRGPRLFLAALRHGALPGRALPGTGGA